MLISCQFTRGIGTKYAKNCRTYADVIIDEEVDLSIDFSKRQGAGNSASDVRYFSILRRIDGEI